eukprot:3138254-Amphidinium_carterae.1
MQQVRERYRSKRTVVAEGRRPSGGPSHGKIGSQTARLPTNLYRDAGPCASGIAPTHSARAIQTQLFTPRIPVQAAKSRELTRKLAAEAPCAGGAG